MGIAKFIGKILAESATNVVTGAADVVLGAAGDIAHSATTKVLNVGNEMHKSKIEKSNMNTQMAEEKLHKLKSLYDAGVLNQAEFESKKLEVLAIM
jgi:uncharacterized protein YbcV (DUF1398 family)